MTDEITARAADERLQAILKAVVVGARVQDPASLAAGEDLSAAFASAGALVPPYDPEALCLVIERSNSLRQNVDAYATNIDGFGHRLEPAIDFDADDADRHVADCIALERQAAKERGELPADAAIEPTEDEVASRKRELMLLARAERARLESFFDFCCFDHSFVDLCRRTPQDIEVTGNAFWNVLCDRQGDLARLRHTRCGSCRSIVGPSRSASASRPFPPTPSTPCARGGAFREQRLAHLRGQERSPLLALRAHPLVAPDGTRRS